MFSLLIIVPLFAVIAMNLLPQKAGKVAAFWMCAAIFAAQLILVVFADADLPITFIKFNLIVDELSRVVLFCIGTVLFASLMTGQQTIKDQDQKYNFHNLLLIILAGMNGVVMVKDVFSLYVFLEITAVASFILICFMRDNGGLEAAFKYLVMSAVATVLMLTSIALLLLLSGSTSFAAINSAILTSPRNSFTMLAIGLFICGLFIKGGLMPFHGWLPDAYSEAPAPVSVLLGGIVTKTVGVYSLIRMVTLVFVLDSQIKYVLLTVGAISIVLGALAALTQTNFKRMLAYSSISQVGYIVIGLGAGTPLGIFGAVFHLFNHSMFKSLLFVNAASVELSAGTRDMEKMSGIAERMPVTGTTSAIAFLSAAGIPPLSGFWSKLIIIMALWMSGQYVFAIIAVMASVITLAYFLSMNRRVFFGKISAELSKIKEAGTGMVVTSIILAAIIIAVGILFPFFINTSLLPAGSIRG